MNADLVGAYHSKVKLRRKIACKLWLKSARCYHGYHAQRFEMGGRYIFFAVFVAALKLVQHIQKRSK